MKTIVVLSGKGGTGKTTITAALVHLASQDPATRPILVDADVDAANLELLLDAQMIETQAFIGGQLASISAEKCAGCGRCEAVCRFDAIQVNNGDYTVNPAACEGCATCQTQCPNEAVTMVSRISGQWFRSGSRYGPLLHAGLSPAQENSGKLVTLLRQHARVQAVDEGYPLVIVDGPPGIGCPAIAAVTGAALALIVTEPTAAGIHDMQRVLNLAAHFGIPTLVCINKADFYLAGTELIQGYCEQRGLPVVGQVPYDLSMAEAMVQGQTITAYRPEGPVSQALRNMWHAILAHVFMDEIV